MILFLLGVYAGLVAMFMLGGVSPYSIPRPVTWIVAAPVLALGLIVAVQVGMWRAVSIRPFRGAHAELVQAREQRLALREKHPYYRADDRWYRVAESIAARVPWCPRVLFVPIWILSIRNEIRKLWSP